MVGALRAPSSGAAMFSRGSGTPGAPATGGCGWLVVFFLVRGAGRPVVVAFGRGLAAGRDVSRGGRPPGIPGGLPVPGVCASGLVFRGLWIPAAGAVRGAGAPGSAGIGCSSVTVVIRPRPSAWVLPDPKAQASAPAGRGAEPLSGSMTSRNAHRQRPSLVRAAGYMSPRAPLPAARGLPGSGHPAAGNLASPPPRRGALAARSSGGAAGNFCARFPDFWKLDWLPGSGDAAAGWGGPPRSGTGTSRAAEGYAGEAGRVLPNVGRTARNGPGVVVRMGGVAGLWSKWLVRAYVQGQGAGLA
jgi:hypothetical protein